MVAFPVHVWLIINVLRELPAWLLRLPLWDVLGVVAYSLMGALIESLLVFTAVVFISFILPARLFRDKFVALSTMAVLLTSVWFVFLHYSNRIIEARQIAPLLLWAISYALLFAGFYLLIHRNQKVESQINAFVRRVAVLSLIYLFFDVVSVIFVIARNI
jgi:hypothetical protein